MNKKVKSIIYWHERKRNDEKSSFYDVHKILVDRWNKSNTPLHCLAHSLNQGKKSKMKTLYFICICFLILLTHQVNLPYVFFM